LVEDRTVTEGKWLIFWSERRHPWASVPAPLGVPIKRPVSRPTIGFFLTASPGRWVVGGLQVETLIEDELIKLILT
jgi:hypothetical protein